MSIFMAFLDKSVIFLHFSIKFSFISIVYNCNQLYFVSYFEVLFLLFRFNLSVPVVYTCVLSARVLVLPVVLRGPVSERMFNKL